LTRPRNSRLSKHVSLRNPRSKRSSSPRKIRPNNLKVINTHGNQVWAFSASNLKEFMSMEHTRPHILKITPKVGDVMLTNQRRPILTVLEDTSGGIHDTVIAACDKYQYKFLGVEEYHDNCTDNLIAGMGELGLEVPEVPSPLNLFMNIPVKEDRT
jgi:uncharacterized protein